MSQTLSAGMLGRIRAGGNPTDFSSVSNTRPVLNKGPALNKDPVGMIPIKFCLLTLYFHEASPFF